MGLFGGRFGIARFEADELYRIALERYENDDLEKAIQNINEAIQLAPAQSEYYAARGYFWLQDGLPDKAEPDFDQALRRNAGEVLAIYGKGIVLFQRDEFAAAIDYFLTAHYADPNRPEPLYYAALTYHRQQNNTQALSWMRAAVQVYEQKNEDQDKPAKVVKDGLKNAQKWVEQFEELVQKQQDAEAAASP